MCVPWTYRPLGVWSSAGHLAAVLLMFRRWTEGVTARESKWRGKGSEANEEEEAKQEN